MKGRMVDIYLALRRSNDIKKCTLANAGLWYEDDLTPPSHVSKDRSRKKRKMFAIPEALMRATQRWRLSYLRMETRRSSEM